MLGCYITGLYALVCLVFVIGLWLMILGYRKYGFSLLTFLAPFVGATLSFPIFFALKERHLKKRNAQADDIKRAHRQTIAGWVFFAAMMVVSMAAGVSFFVDKMDAIEAGADVEYVVWAERLFWGCVAVCGAYAVTVFSICCCKKSDGFNYVEKGDS